MKNRIFTHKKKSRMEVEIRTEEIEVIYRTYRRKCENLLSFSAIMRGTRTHKIFFEIKRGKLE